MSDQQSRSLIDRMWVKLSPLYDAMERLNYYQLLGVKPTDSADHIVQAYQKIAMLLHPDRHYNRRGDETTKKIYSLFKRMTEAYQVLTDSLRRRDYDRQLGEGKLRFNFSNAKFLAAESLDKTTRTPEARELVEMGLELAKLGDLAGAKMNYQMALGYEPDNQRLQLEVEQIDQQLESQ